MIGLYMVLWGKSKETKKVTHLEITSELQEIQVVVTSTIVDHDCSNNNHTNGKSNIVDKDHKHECDNSSKGEQEGQGT